ncbi:MAG: sulfurtransferase [Nitrospira sp.]|nr:sulfurtransferase [Nitrospira sp.]MCP9462161.1 sulfurtransferase [Nitrospira sp.]MCP9474310.1 sulfurtransferase [Nitrospira sp.]
MNHPLLIETETLQSRLGEPGLVVVDVRGRASYEFGGHIPGAVHTTWHEYSDPAAVTKSLLNPDLAQIERRLGALGIGNETEVVVYSNPYDNWGDEGRMFWMLEYLGHTRVSILNGGWVKWTAEKRPFEHGPASPRAGTFKAHPVKDVAVTKDDLKRIVRGPHPQTAVLDARSLEEYLGKEISGIPRPGHIPSAIHVAWNQFLNKDATVKDPQIIREMMEERGIRSDQELVCYCLGGIRSAWLYFVLKVAGYRRVRNYPGSWWEWSRDFACPVERDFQGLQKILGFDQAAGSA